MRIKLLFCALLICINTQDLDWSFKEMCEFYRSSYTQRSDGMQSTEGDRCDFEFQIVFGNDEEATMYCEENVPYHILGVQELEDKKILVCKAEATLICANGWVQMFGRCYKMVRKMMTREEAGKTCANEKLPDGNPTPTIAFMHREALPFRINDYFNDVSRLWLDASEAITRDLIYDKGDNLLLALYGYPFSLPNVALARVDSTVKAMALCEYTPRMNPAESNYLLKKFGEIYHETIITSNGAYVKTASVLQRSSDDKLHDTKYCQAVMRPFIGTDDSISAIPDRAFLDALTKNRKSEIIRTSVYSADADPTGRSNGKCSNYVFDYKIAAGVIKSKKMDGGNIWRPNEPNAKCDGGGWSTGVVLSRSSDTGLESMSDARYAPIYCQTIFDVVEYGDCESGWTPHFRKDLGQKFCHQFFADQVTYDEAENRCQKLGAHVSGFSSLEELDVMDRMLTEAAKTVDFHLKFTYIGAKRRPECLDKLGGIENEGGFNPDPTHVCARVRVFQWVNDVAPNPPIFHEKQLWGMPYEPNHHMDKEQCVTLMKGDYDFGGWPKGVLRDKKLNDYPCESPWSAYYFCGKEAPLVITKNSNFA